ncbi:PTS system cellobiose-specific IIA componenent [Enterococcus phoeniculicola]|jgi:PTS system cellobiose-specific IIA component|uniref:PTS system cellobiose-specific IIA componenent n=1 Tax=Enterococcus phoeniculicola ATCC BAA-412 TaxID=1158610 RepID=R3U9J9_9ENTE|nr:PTS system cellobiose-specific IIA componenent [Enterococcus phoeniculicola ATCC BAA-412]EOT70702.1 PTS system cellobiose-specific IIA componenent [Enterococcus phoeniculicola ATCC BAA-412]OJG69676.1 PTS system cellobiose-specific IIA componenent [Enterococcus phoeniculicola]
MTQDIEKVMSSEEIQVAAFEIILNSGNARTTIHKSFAAMRKSDFSHAEQLLTKANEEILQAHKSQTALLKDYAGGKKIEMEIIMVHAQDHLMTTMTLLEVAQEMKYLYEQIAQNIKN